MHLCVHLTGEFMHATYMHATNASGKVWILGAGPGDPELLTLKALRALEVADLILFDHLVSTEIRALFPAAVPAFYVGKKKGQHSIAQKDLNALLIRKAREGKNICRVKGGDPYVFGRGGEEALALVQAGVAVEVVPGVTSASGCTTYAGIPLTHRGLAQGCTFVTAHGETEADLNWSALAQVRHTLVFYMGLSKAAWIQQSLRENGMAGRTPVAFIENGCRENQRVITGCLSELAQLVERCRIQSPALIVVGEVVGLAAELSPENLNSEFYSQFHEQRLSA
jgi:uroporphyrin-III C-methyltransferase